MKVSRLWVRQILWLARVICNVSWQVQGKEHLQGLGTERGLLVASKHQSMFETMALNLILPEPAFIAKLSLFRIPLFGWYFWRTGAIGLDRAEGAQSLRKLADKAKFLMAERRSLIIFPEGTRVPIGKKSQYKRGIASLYELTNHAVVPVVLDSGYCWPKNPEPMRPGMITVKILPPIKPGLSRDEFMKTLIETLDSESQNLMTNLLTNSLEGKHRENQ